MAALYKTRPQGFNLKLTESTARKLTTTLQSIKKPAAASGLLKNSLITANYH
jgi:hypothetical protein